MQNAMVTQEMTKYEEQKEEGRACQDEIGFMFCIHIIFIRDKPAIHAVKHINIIM